jgi:hypothetical protein
MTDSTAIIEFFKDHVSERLKSVDEGQKQLTAAISDLRVQGASAQGEVRTLNEKVTGMEKGQNAMVFKVVLPVLMGIILTAINVVITLKH